MFTKCYEQLIFNIEWKTIVNQIILTITNEIKEIISREIFEAKQVSIHMDLTQDIILFK